LERLFHRRNKKRFSYLMIISNERFSKSPLVFEKRLNNTRGIIKNMNQILSVVVHKEKKFYVAECPEVGTVSQGGTIEEAIQNLKEATELYLEEFPLQQKSF
jgi:predicted RNase H-like HicB family nuclease